MNASPPTSSPRSHTSHADPIPSGFLQTQPTSQIWMLQVHSLVSFWPNIVGNSFRNRLKQWVGVELKTAFPCLAVVEAVAGLALLADCGTSLQLWTGGGPLMVAGTLWQLLASRSWVLLIVKPSPSRAGGSVSIVVSIVGVRYSIWWSKALCLRCPFFRSLQLD